MPNTIHYKPLKENATQAEKDAFVFAVAADMKDGKIEGSYQGEKITHLVNTYDRMDDKADGRINSKDIYDFALITVGYGTSDNFYTNATSDGRRILDSLMEMKRPEEHIIQERTLRKSL
jgi:hypothetical protein